MISMAHLIDTDGDREIDRFFAAMQEVAQIGGWCFHVIHNRLTWSAETFRIHDLDPKTPLDVSTAIDYYAQKARPVIAEAVTNCVEKGAPFDLELPLISARGRHLWVRTMGRARVADGRVREIYGVFQDITEQRLTRMVLEASHSARRAYLDHKGDIRKIYEGILAAYLSCTESEYGFVGDVLIDPQTGQKYLRSFGITDISWNEETKRYYDENVSKGFEFKNLNNLFGWVIINEKILATNDPQNHPASGGLPPGHPPLSAFLGLPIFYEGRLIAMVGLANREGGYDDLMVRQVESLSSTVADLITHIRKDQRDAHIKALEEELLHQERLATVGQLAAGIGHEINNPLMIANLSVEQIKIMLEKSGQLTSHQVEIFERYESAAQRIVSIVEGLRTYSRAGSGEKTHIALREVIIGVDRLLREILRHEGVKLLVRHPEQPIFVDVNLIQLQQVFVNLINNARDALSSAADRTIVINVAEPHRGWVKIEVADKGRGIPKEQQDRVFDAFWTTKPLGQGTGLGLSLSRSIIMEHGGRMRIVSEEGMGTNVTIELPVATDTVVAVPENAAVEEVVRHPSLKGRSLLVVEDEDALRTLIGDKCAALGMNVCLVASADEALRVLRNQKYDFLLTDLQMPGMTGAELIFQMRREKFHQPKILVSSGGVREGWEFVDGENLKPLISGYLQKPFKISDLVKMLGALAET